MVLIMNKVIKEIIKYIKDILFHEKYKEYKDTKQTIEESLEMLEEESDEEMRELAKEELMIEKLLQF